MSPNQAIPAEKSICFSPLAAAQRLTIFSWPEALNAIGSRRACRMAISRNDRPLIVPGLLLIITHDYSRSLLPALNIAASKVRS